MVRQVATKSHKEKSPVSEHIVTILTSNGFELLKYIAQIDLVGLDAEPFVRALVVSLLDANYPMVEFLKAILLKKKNLFGIKQMDIQDIFRDNGVTTMFFTMFLDLSFRPFLKEAISCPMENIVKMADNWGLEVDPDRLPIDSRDIQDILDGISENEERLKQAISIIFEAFLHKVDAMPVELRKLLNGIANVLELEVGADEDIDAELFPNAFKKTNEPAEEVEEGESSGGAFNNSDNPNPNHENEDEEDPQTIGRGGPFQQMKQSEKIIGSLLFLRFFVPAITNPIKYEIIDLNGIYTTSEKRLKMNGSSNLKQVKPSSKGGAGSKTKNITLSAAQMRGLVYCAKLIALMAADQVPGNKDSHLAGFKDFVKSKRYLVKEFYRIVVSDDFLFVGIENEAKAAQAPTGFLQKFSGLFNSNNFLTSFANKSDASQRTSGCSNDSASSPPNNSHATSGKKKSKRCRLVISADERKYLYSKFIEIASANLIQQLEVLVLSSTDAKSPDLMRNIAELKSLIKLAEKEKLSAETEKQSKSIPENNSLGFLGKLKRIFLK